MKSVGSFSSGLNFKVNNLYKKLVIQPFFKGIFGGQFSNLYTENRPCSVYCTVHTVQYLPILSFSATLDDSVLAETKYVDLPAKAIMIDHESIENLPVDLDNENETKYKVEVVSINHVNGWPIYNLEPLEKYVNGELVPVVTGA